jgi:hypothetical protein
MSVGSDGQETDHLRRSNYTAARAGLESLPAIICAHGKRATRRFIEFFTATIRNRNARMASARGKMPLRSVRTALPRAGGHRAHLHRGLYRGQSLLASIIANCASVLTAHHTGANDQR